MRYQCTNHWSHKSLTKMSLSTPSYNCQVTRVLHLADHPKLRFQSPSLPSVGVAICSYGREWGNGLLSGLCNSLVHVQIIDPEFHFGHNSLHFHFLFLSGLSLVNILHLNTPRWTNKPAHSHSSFPQAREWTNQVNKYHSHICWLYQAFSLPS